MALSRHSSEQNIWSQNLHCYSQTASRLHEDVGMFANAALTSITVRSIFHLLAYTTQSSHKEAYYKPRGFFPLEDERDFEYIVFSMLFAKAFDDGISSDIGSEEMMNPPRSPIYWLAIIGTLGLQILMITK